MVPRLRCLATNFRISASSSWFSGRSRAGRVAGAPGRSSIAWSHTVCWGSLWDFSLLNTFWCCLYSAGIICVVLGVGGDGWTVTLPM